MLTGRRMIWLLPHPLPPLPVSKRYRRHTGRLRKRDNLPSERGGEGMGEQPFHTTARKPGPLLIVQNSLSRMETPFDLHRHVFTCSCHEAVMFLCAAVTRRLRFWMQLSRGAYIFVCSCHEAVTFFVCSCHDALTILCAAVTRRELWAWFTPLNISSSSLPERKVSFYLFFT